VRTVFCVYQDMLQYRKKLRPLRVRTLDSSIKTLLVDDSQTVAELTRTVCARIGETSGTPGATSARVGVVMGVLDVNNE